MRRLALLLRDMFEVPGLTAGGLSRKEALGQLVYPPPCYPRIPQRLRVKNLVRHSLRRLALRS